MLVHKPSKRVFYLFIGLTVVNILLTYISYLNLFISIGELIFGAIMMQLAIIAACLFFLLITPIKN